MKTFAERLRRARKEAGMSQAELGSALGVSGQSVKEWEAGRASPQFERLADISRVTDKPIAWFFQDGESSLQSLRAAAAEAKALTHALEGLQERLEGLAGRAQRPWSAYRDWAEEILAAVAERLPEDRWRRAVDELAQGRWERERLV